MTGMGRRLPIRIRPLQVLQYLPNGMDPSHFYPASQWAKMGIELTIDKVGGSEMKIKTLSIDLAKRVYFTCMASIRTGRRS
jgi:hypothetical protein